MITDNETNFLYLADSLKRPKYSTFLSCFTDALDALAIPYGFLPGTKDIWAVDYMPLQIGEMEFLHFRYNPDYLQSKTQIKTISDVQAICKQINIIYKQSDLIVDGGNIVKEKNKVIMSDKVFHENSHLTEKEVIDRLYNSLQVQQIIFVPWDKHDAIGHADGMVRFIDSGTVLINDYSGEDIGFQRCFRSALRNAGLEFVELPYDVSENKPSSSARGIYINYLQMAQGIIMPTFDRKADDRAFKQLESIFKRVKTVPSNEIADGGGVLNCITWNIYNHPSQV